MKFYKYIMFALFVLVMLLPAADLFAACTFPGGCCPTGFPPQMCPDCPPCTPVPLDGGLTALLVAGVAYGAKRLYGKQKL